MKKTSSPIAGQNLLKGSPEVQIEDGVYDGVESRIDISQPRDEILQPFCHFLFSEWQNDVHGEEG